MITSGVCYSNRKLTNTVELHQPSEEGFNFLFLGQQTEIGCMYCKTQISSNFECLLFCPCPETRKETEFKGGGLTNLEEGISKQPNFQFVSWVLLATFSQISSENWEQKMDK